MSVLPFKAHQQPFYRRITSLQTFKCNDHSYKQVSCLAALSNNYVPHNMPINQTQL